MIPVGATLTNQTTRIVEQPSLTWKLDAVKQRITGRIDGREAVSQAAAKILQTPRFHHLIYTADYGSELDKLIGSNPVFVQAEISRMLREALLQDERILAIENLRIESKGESILAEFTVNSNYGNFDMSQEVRA